MNNLFAAVLMVDPLGAQRERERRIEELIARLERKRKRRAMIELAILILIPALLLLAWAFWEVMG